MDNLFTVSGNIRKDHFGRIVVDSCESDLDHNVNAVPKPGDDRARCRSLVEEAFADFIGKRGTMVVSILFQEEAVEGAMPTAALDVHSAETRKVVSPAPATMGEAVQTALEHVDGK